MKNIIIKILVGFSLVFSIYSSAIASEEQTYTTVYRSERIDLGDISLEIPVPEYYTEYDMSDIIWHIAKSTIIKPAGEEFTYEEINDAVSWAIPKNWDFKQRHNSNRATIGSCDTDAHCADLYAYRKQGIISVSNAPENAQFTWDKDSDVVSIGCEDGRTILAKDTLDKFYICTSPEDLVINIQEGLYNEGSGYSEFDVDRITLDYLIKEGMAFKDSKMYPTAPTTGDFLKLMKKHPNYYITALGHVEADLFYGDQGELLSVDVIEDREFEVKLDRVQLVTTNHIPKWFSDFCASATIQPELKKGQYHPICIWK